MPFSREYVGPPVPIYSRARDLWRPLSSSFSPDLSQEAHALLVEWAIADEQAEMRVCLGILDEFLPDS